MSNQVIVPDREVPIAAGGFAYGQAAAFAVVCAGVIAAFFRPILEWIAFCRHSELYSHCLLIPFVTGYFVWIQRKSLAVSRRWDWVAAVPAAGAGALAGGYWLLRRSGEIAAIEDRLAMLMGAFFLLLIAGAVFCFGRRLFFDALFAFVFLLFAVPWPNFLMDATVVFLQHGSADVSEVFLRLSGMTLLREGTYFALPGFSMEVAPECSGIHSTLALFISSLAAGHLLLNRWQSRTLLAVLVLPLALLRNALRIFTIGMLCVYVTPEMIHSYIHRSGGPVFFAFSLIPLFLVLLLLRRNDLLAGRKREAGDQ